MAKTGIGKKNGSKKRTGKGVAPMVPKAGVKPGKRYSCGGKVK